MFSKNLFKNRFDFVQDAAVWCRITSKNKLKNMNRRFPNKALELPNAVLK